MSMTGSSGFRALWLGCVVLLLGLPVRSDEPDPMNRVDFEVERTREVANDWVRAVVGVSDEQSDAAALADSVNRSMAWALDLAKSASGVRAKSGGYHTSPVYQDGKLRRWRASQELILESADPEAVSELVGSLQERLQLRSIGFTVSPELRRSTQDALIKDALAAFQTRAELVTESLGARGWELVHVSIDTGGGPPIRPQHFAEAAVMRSSSAPAPPALEGGSSRLSVTARGSIELE